MLAEITVLCSWVKECIPTVHLSLRRRGIGSWCGQRDKIIGQTCDLEEEVEILGLVTSCDGHQSKRYMVSHFVCRQTM